MGERLINRRNPTFTSPPNPLQGSYDTFNAGVDQNAEDYDSIMGGYKQLLERNKTALDPNSLKKYNPTTYDYKESADTRSSLNNLGELSKTGGYSEADIANLRARGISPIRAIYANAQRNLARGKALQGGYSPNAAAAGTRMAREQSDLISGAVQNVNAGIAQNQASNRLQAAPAYAGAAAHDQDTRNTFGRGNVDILNDAAKFNVGNEVDFNKLRGASDLGALQGMTSLYGTTPALANTFGNQALRAADMQSNNINAGNSTGLQAIGSTLTRRPSRLG